jgi:oligopeptide/dipeptide ABC transporter ATP-binding protein
MTPVLDVRDLTLVLRRPPADKKAGDKHGDDVPVVDGVSFALSPERTLGLVGESGCGKTLTSLALLRLEPDPPMRIARGAMLLSSGEAPVDLATLDPHGPAIRAIRGKDVAMIFQEPMTALDPVYSIGDQIAEAVRLHQRRGERIGRAAAWARAIEMLAAVGIAAPAQRAREYPFQLSGGMRQRAMIAMALVANPAVLIADEPTTALDVTVQAQVLDLMGELRNRFRTAILFISHDLGVIATMADDVAIMYLGRIVEQAPVRTLFRGPAHPYTRGLLASLPTGGGRLVPIAGAVPQAGTRTPGCAFAPRCPHAMARCREAAPPLREIASGHGAACWLHG